MKTNDYVSYDLALKLKACGFDEPCDHYYTTNKTLHIVKSNALAPEITNNRFLDEIADGCCAAVPLWHAQKWLREKWGIDVDVRTTKIPKRKYGYVVYDKIQHFSHEEYCAYEQALSAGISAALEIIKV